MVEALGRLERVELRRVWKSESGNFTPWLAQPTNLTLLGEAIGLELELEAQEKDVGPFRADILCKDVATNAWVLIENQLERTDHTHLGQLMTYAAGLEAVVLVWIAERFTEEHRAAFDWLNELASEKLRCFGLEIELWKIGDSPPAPKFNVVSQPNDFVRTLASSARQAGQQTETKQLQLDFWTAFADLLRTESKVLRPTKPLPQHWMNVALGRRGIHLAAIATTYNNVTNSYDGEIRAEVIVGHPENAKAWYAALEAQKTAIEAEIGEPLNWHNPTSARMCRIFARNDAPLTDRNDWPRQQRWLLQKLEALHRVFAPRVKLLVGPGEPAMVPVG